MMTDQTGYYCLRQFGAIIVNGTPIPCPSCRQTAGPWLLIATPAGTAYILCVCSNRFTHWAVTPAVISDHFTIESAYTSVGEVEAEFLANPAPPAPPKE